MFSTCVVASLVPPIDARCCCGARIELRAEVEPAGERREEGKLISDASGVKATGCCFRGVREIVPTDARGEGGCNDDDRAAERGDSGTCCCVDAGGRGETAAAAAVRIAIDCLYLYRPNLVS